MANDIIYPKLRFPIDIRLEKVENEEIILVNCPIGISKAPLALIPAVGPVIACFEGQLSVQDILNKFSAHGLTPELLQSLIKLLDENLYLASPRFFQAQSLNEKEFRDSSTRPAALAGRAYSNSKIDLEADLERYLSYGHPVAEKSNLKLYGLVSPHIDYRRGQITYGKTYSYLKHHYPDLYVLIGTSHQYSNNIFHLSSKHFDSPLGVLHCDTEFILKLAHLNGHEKSFEEEILHKQEHSLELQVPYIKHLKAEPKIAPILVGSFHHMLQSSKTPKDFEEYDRFAESLAQCLKDYIKNGKTPCIVAGVDMAHVGRYFGDKQNLNQKKMEEIEIKDKYYLDCIINQDKKSLFEHVEEDMDERRICGFPTMYTVIDCFDRIGIKYICELFEYRQAVDYTTDCAVTFAGMGIYIP